MFSQLPALFACIISSARAATHTVSAALGQPSARQKTAPTADAIAAASSGGWPRATSAPSAPAYLAAERRPMHRAAPLHSPFFRARDELERVQHAHTCSEMLRPYTLGLAP